MPPPTALPLSDPIDPTPGDVPKLAAALGEADKLEEIRLSDDDDAPATVPPGETERLLAAAIALGGGGDVDRPAEPRKKAPAPPPLPEPLGGEATIVWVVGMGPAEP